MEHLYKDWDDIPYGTTVYYYPSFFGEYLGWWTPVIKEEENIIESIDNPGKTNGMHNYYRKVDKPKDYLNIEELRVEKENLINSMRELLIDFQKRTTINVRNITATPNNFIFTYDNHMVLDFDIYCELDI